MREALDRLQAVNEALSAFQRGEEGALDRLESLFRGDGGAFADAREALGRFARRDAPGEVLIRGLASSTAMRPKTPDQARLRQSLNHATNFGMPTSIGVVGFQPRSRVVAEISA